MVATEQERATDDRIANAVCDKCLTVARVSGIGGWLFHCDRCGAAWGHPQAMTENEAQQIRHDALMREHVSRR